jgi:diaminohydroxyphosphoribosylaminopyrimidine deaminase/5-amino-6-(5-phosphoribosylamino)uracil reductase
MSNLLTAVERSLNVSEETRGRTAPNPSVGACVLDREGKILSVAAHGGAGSLHAEALAIQQARQSGLLERAHQIVVTLEPCSHFGRTPPCVDAILETPIRQVFYGVRDPNPKVSGSGAEKLSAQGLRVQSWSEIQLSDGSKMPASLIERARDLIRPFVKSVRENGALWITVKIARTSQKGSLTETMIPPTGQKTFTSARQLAMAHRLRKRADALITGSGTVLADSPLFSVRHVMDHALTRRKPLLILDRRRRVPREYLESASLRGFDPLVCSDWEEAIAFLQGRGLSEALLEAGPTLTQDCLERGLWDEKWEMIQDPELQLRVTASPDSW